MTAGDGLSYCHGQERKSDRYKRLLPVPVPKPTGHVKKPFEPDPYVSVESVEIIRIVPVKELAESECYREMAALAVIFHHDVVEVSSAANLRNDRTWTWRWRPNAFADWILQYAGVYVPSGPDNTARGQHIYGWHSASMRASLCLDTLMGDLRCGAFSMEEWMKFYMQVGYSLSGYAEVFGQHEADEFGLPGARERVEGDDKDQFVETVIEYMTRKHAGKVLKL